ncbi:MAG TPA: EamA family transporter [Blastocatellia bacterium]|nr:EamA family transporter [Blastocatellia bacterium]
MKSFYFPILMTIAGGVLYHVGQKAVPQTVHPFAAVIVAYSVGILLCVAGLFLDPAGRSFSASFKDANWAVISVGLGAVIIEIGFLLAYRHGWNINAASVVCNISVALLLIPIGLLVFKEHLSFRHAAGIGCCLIGLYLLSKR